MVSPCGAIRMLPFWRMTTVPDAGVDLGAAWRRCRRLRLGRWCGSGGRTGRGGCRTCENCLRVAWHWRHRRRRPTHDVLRSAALIAARESIDVDLGRLGDRAAHAGLGLEGAGGVIAEVILGDDDDEQHVGIAAGTEYVGLSAYRKLVFDSLRPDLDATETHRVRVACRKADAVLSRLAQIGRLIRRPGRLRSRLTPLFACGRCSQPPYADRPTDPETW